MVVKSRPRYYVQFFGSSRKVEPGYYWDAKVARAKAQQLTAETGRETWVFRKISNRSGVLLARYRQAPTVQQTNNPQQELPT